MADEPKPDIDDELLLDDQVDPNEDDDDQRSDDDDSNVNDEGEETVLTFGDDAAEQDGDSGLVKHLRGLVRAKEKELSEARRTAPREEAIEVGEKPTMMSCDLDEERYEEELDAWKDRKAKADAHKGQSVEAEETQRKAWEGEINRYNEGKVKLGFADVDDAEENVKASLSVIQQAAMVRAANDSAKIMYALGKHPDRLTAVSEIHDPIKFAAEIGRLEGQIKMTKRRKAPDPEKIERGSGRVSTPSPDKKLEKLEKEAGLSGDRTALIRYKNEIAAKAKEKR